MDLFQLRLLHDPDERLLDDYYGIDDGWMAWTLWDSGVWALVGFRFWDMGTVMCYPICIREFMLILLGRFSLMILYIDKSCTSFDK